MEEAEVGGLILHPCGDFALSKERFELYRLGLLPLRCHTCGLQKPNIMKEAQDEQTR